MIMYTFIRTDMEIQHQMVQACHSGIEAASEFKKPGQIPFLILLKIKDDKGLLKAERLLQKHGIKYHKFFEPDNNLGHTSITTEPLSKDQKKIFKSYSLWKAS